MTRRKSPKSKSKVDEVSAYFDAKFYRLAYYENSALTDKELLEHFLSEGWIKGLDPLPTFSTLKYLKHNPDVGPLGSNPLLHFIAYGEREKRRVSLSLWGAEDGPDIERAIIEKTQEFFDAEHYVIQSPRLAQLDQVALLSHFLMVGWKSELSPNAVFSCEAYLASRPDVRKAGINPLIHYALYSSKELESPRDIASGADMAPGPLSEGAANPVEPSKQTERLVNTELADTNINPLPLQSEIERAPSVLTDPPLKVQVKAVDLNAVREFFNAEYYRMVNPNLEPTDDEALLLHFMEIGWREGLDPSPNFSTNYYIGNYQDIGRAGLNPFLHYVLFGAGEGRRPRGDTPLQLNSSIAQALIPPHLKSVVVPHTKIRNRKRSTTRINLSALTQHWIIPDFEPGAGGHMTIFRMIKFQELFGHRCKIWIENPQFHATAEAAWETIIKHFQCLAAEVAFVDDGFLTARGDAVIATGWTTAYLAKASNGFDERFYFVQDHETEFYPMGSERLLAEQTYRFDLSCICASPWLEQLMRDGYGRWARGFYLAYDPEVYNENAVKDATPKGPTERRIKIAVYSRNHTQRRCVYLALMAIDILAHHRDDFEIHFFGQDDLPFKSTRFHALNHGVLNSERLADLYRGCDIGICFSGTNYSLVPQEMMACGLPVVELDGESTRAVYPPGVVTFSGPDPMDIASKVEALLNSAALRQRQASLAKEWVARFTWEDAARTVEAAIRDRLTEKQPQKIAAPSKAQPPEVLLDVVIPTWNGKGEVEQVIEALRKQRMAGALQIYCIDSSSTDGTAEWLRAQPDVILMEIDQKEFQHGRTRNVAAAAGTAPIIAFLTQDAIPASNTWAHDICAMFKHVPHAAGLFGRHIPYPHHPEWVRGEIISHFEGMVKYPIMLSKDTDERRWSSGDLSWRQLLHYYSDNNSAMRRDVWNLIPYPEINYGEDQVWARQLIEAGYTKLYAPSACVYHSHNYGTDETYDRSKTEASFFFEHFGYELGGVTDAELLARVSQDRSSFLAWAANKSIDEAEIQLHISNIDAKQRGLRDGLRAAKLFAGRELKSDD